MSRIFNSIYGVQLAKFCDWKRKAGYKYRHEEYLLGKIDTLAIKRNETLIGITEAFVGEWIKKRSNESELYRYQRGRILREFSIYLCDQGIPSFIPRLPKKPLSTFVPYIYSPQQINALFKASDGLTLGTLQTTATVISIPPLIRLLYSTGLRIGEALALTDDDVNLDEEYLLVKDSKNCRERVIPLSSSLVSVLREFLKFRARLNLHRKPERFFIKLNGKGCKSIRSWFARCLREAGIRANGRHGRPRIHDLRHTFAVSSLVSMSKAGIDLYVALPILSNYLGHQTISSTNHYVRMTANMYPELLKQVDENCLNVFPKINEHDYTNENENE